MIITSKFPGRCITCSKAVQPGQRVDWVKGRKGVTCCLDGKAIAETIAEATAASRATDADIHVPAPAGLDYLPFQRAGVAYAMRAKEGVLFGDEMGLGKTVQVVGFINADPGTARVLVICPKSLTLNWQRELRRWLTRPLKVDRIAYETGETNIVIASYDEAKKFQEHITARLWDLLVVDEAHLIKNDKAQRTKAVHAIAQRCRRRLALTGTPIANRPVELFSILKLVAPLAWDPAGRGFFPFALRYCGAHKEYHGGRSNWDMSGASNLPELQEKLRTTCMIRRLKKDVLKDLPPKRRQIVVIDDEKAASAVRAENKAWAAQEGRLEQLRVDAELARAADDPTAYTEAVTRLQAGAGAAFAEISRIRHATAVAKIDAVIEHALAALEEDPDKKLLVFGHHLDVIDGIAAGLAAYRPVKLTGETALDDRQKAVETFQNDPRCRVFVGGIQAAGVGLTLTASSHVIFAELSWVPGEVTQAEDRAHRIGQEESVLVQHLVLDGSLDARMVQILVEKQAIADQGLDIARHEPVLPSERPATEGKRADLDKVAAKLTQVHIDQVHAALRALAAACDGAVQRDGAGFSKIDGRLGHSLAGAPRLSARQAALGLRLVRKYRRQLGELAILNLEQEAA